MRNVRINEAGHIVVKNLSAYWIPEIKVEREMHGTVYTVTGSYEGTELPNRKLTRILLKNVEDDSYQQPAAGQRVSGSGVNSNLITDNMESGHSKNLEKSCVSLYNIKY